MGTITYYVAMGFDRDEEGELVAVEPMKREAHPSRYPARGRSRLRKLAPSRSPEWEIPRWASFRTRRFCSRRDGPKDAVASAERSKPSSDGNGWSTWLIASAGSAGTSSARGLANRRGRANDPGNVASGMSLRSFGGREMTQRSFRNPLAWADPPGIRLMPLTGWLAQPSEPDALSFIGASTRRARRMPQSRTLSDEWKLVLPSAIGGKDLFATDRELCNQVLPFIRDDPVCKSEPAAGSIALCAPAGSWWVRR